jgi:hypothetical protein
MKIYTSSVNKLQYIFNYVKKCFMNGYYTGWLTAYCDEGYKQYTQVNTNSPRRPMQVLSLA